MENLDRVELNDGPEGATIKVRVKPKGRANNVIGVRGDALLVSVTAAPEQGKANRAVIEVLAEALALPKGAINIVSGEAHREKALHVSGLTADEVKARLSIE